MKIFGAIFALFILPTLVPACSCISLDESLEKRVQGQVGSASVVFQGKASDYLERKGTDRLYLRFAVDRVWKGEVYPEFELETDTISTPNGHIGMNSCEYNFEKDMTYLVFAYKTAKGWATGDCSGTTQVKQKEWDKAVLKALGPGKEPEKKLSAFLTNNPFELIFAPEICRLATR